MKPRRLPPSLRHSMLLHDNEGYAADVATAEFFPEPRLISMVQTSPWYDEDELFPWELINRSRKRTGEGVRLTPAVIRWIEAKAKDNPVSHSLYNGGSRSYVLAMHVLRAMLGIKWTAKTEANWFRYRAWRVTHEAERTRLLASSGLIGIDAFIDGVMKGDGLF